MSERFRVYVLGRFREDREQVEEGIALACEQAERVVLGKQPPQ